MTESWDKLAEARLTFADVIETLSPDQHTAATLCDDWSVHHVVAHLVSFIERTPEEFGADFAKAGSITGAMDLGVEARLNRPVSELLSVLREHASTPVSPPAFEDGMVGDTLIHLQDIRRPLGLGTDIDPNTLRAMLEFITSHENAEMVTGSLTRTRGLHLVATDLGWSAGEGPTVEGPGEAIVMAAAGRTAAVPDLAGEGVNTLRSRIGS
jgi:uncharacterized protein (TIGR03083 family)